MKKKIFIILGILFAILIILVILFLNDSDFNRFKKSLKELPSNLENKEEVIIALAGGIFFPDILILPKDLELVFTLRSIDFECDMVIDEFKFKVGKVFPGQEKSKLITLNKEGEFEYYCSGMKESGVVGKLIVQ